MRISLAYICIIVPLALAPSYGAIAQTSSPGVAAQPSVPTPAENRVAVQAIANRFPVGGDGLKAEILSWLVANPGRYLAVFDVARISSAEQQLSFGTAVGEYTRSLRQSDPLAAQALQREALNSGMPGFISQYAIASGDTQTAATGGGGAGGGAGGGSGGPTTVTSSPVVSNSGGGSTNAGTGSRTVVSSTSFLQGISGSILGCTSTSTNRC